jgi:hypothetical protein
MNQKPQKRSRNQSNRPGTDKGKIRKVKAAEKQADQHDKKIIDTEECLDRRQVFLFTFDGRQKIEGRSRTAGGKEAIKNSADYPQNGSRHRSWMNMDPVREEKEKKAESID